MCVCEFVCVKCHVCVCVLKLYSTLWDPMDCNQPGPLSIGFSRQEYCNRLLFPSPGDLPNPEIKLESPMSPALQEDSLTAEPSGKPVKCHGKHQLFIYLLIFIFLYTQCWSVVPLSKSVCPFLYDFVWTRFIFLMQSFFFIVLCLLLVALGLRCCTWAFSSCCEPGLLFAGQALGTWASRVAAHGLCCSVACGVHPDQGLNPCPLHWQPDS